ncbi:hypothetical protein M3484_16385 [Pseudomonas sp. GX19020]|uniref:hypothetical protein n=1 Tax=Pseudomonas sp. GX19020 TaxID=2942277 RepID=UPI002019A57A|nr:hypothetical protein [Pseudomonas sp. GX19020]MCL4068150.1 hypothetical protein [Pseudomonas sp. GX19020]
MQTPAYKPVRGEVRKTPVRSPRWISRARIAFVIIAGITFLLGLALGSGWWVFTAFSVFAAFVGGRQPYTKPNSYMLEALLAEPPRQESPSAMGQDLTSRSIWG